MKQLKNKLWQIFILITYESKILVKKTDDPFKMTFETKVDWMARVSIKVYGFKMT